MSARRRRFNEPSPVEFGPALLGVSPRESAFGAPEGVLTGRTAATVDSTHSESVLGASSLAASDIPQLRDDTSLLLDSEDPSNDAKTPQLASSLTTMIVSRRSGSFRNLVSASGSVAVAVTPRRVFGRSDDSTTPPPTPSQLANTEEKGPESDDVEGGEPSLHPYTPLLHIDEDESDVHTGKGRSRLQTPQQQQRTPPRQLPPITHQHHQQQRTSSEPQSSSHMMQSSLSTSSAAPPRRSELTFPSELCCPVCLDPFHTPVTLSCSHNVCHEHILDLAAAVAPGGVLPRPSASSGGHLIVDSLHIQCPKCREPTVFPNGMQSVHVNVEMKALVDMMVVMLSQQQQQHPPPPTVLKRSGTPGGDVGGSEGGGSGRISPSSRPQSSGNNNKRSSSRERGGKPRAVRFTEEDIVLDDAHDGNSSVLGDGQAQPPRVPPPSALKKSSSAPDSTSIAAEAISTGVASARKLEQQLRLQREQLREERERQAKEKLEEFKKQRREEIERRKEEAEASAALLQKNDDQPSPPLSTPALAQPQQQQRAEHLRSDDHSWSPSWARAASNILTEPHVIVRVEADCSFAAGRRPRCVYLW